VTKLLEKKSPLQWPQQTTGGPASVTGSVSPNLIGKVSFLNRHISLVNKTPTDKNNTLFRSFKSLKLSCIPIGADVDGQKILIEIYLCSHMRSEPLKIQTLTWFDTHKGDRVGRGGISTAESSETFVEFLVGRIDVE